MTAPLVPENLKSRLKASYDAIATKYNEWTIPHSEKRLKYLDMLLELLPFREERPLGNLRVLELGCGCGLPVTQKLLSHVSISVIANDLSSTQIELARGNLLKGGSGPQQTGAEAEGRLTLMEGDMTTLSFPDASLDAVLGLYSIIHLPRTEQAELLRKISGWLKPGGYLLANFAESEIEGLVIDRWLDEKAGWMFWSGWGPKGTVRIAEDAGLEVVVTEVEHDIVDASFLWLIARKP